MAWSEGKLPGGRIILVQYVLLAAFLFLGYGMWQLQVLQQARWETLAEHNRIRSEPIPAPRGRIYDRQGRLLVDNYPSFSALLVPDQARDLANDIAGIARGLGMKPSDVSDRLARYQDAPSYQPIIIKEDITPSDLAFIASHRDQYPELETITVSRRLYPSDGYAMHVIGYVGEATEADIQRLRVTPGTLVGKSGLEQYYNSILMGQDGLRRVIVDSRGRVEGEISDLPPRPGHDLRLTLDKDIQDAAEEAIGQRPGAIVALDPRNGEVLAMVSRPTFDPNLFTLGISSQEWQKLVDDPNRPLLDKAIQAQLAPGSVFKIVMSVAGLEEGIAETMKVNCQGGAWFYGQYKKCWISREHKVHGITDIRKAITQSCDVYFYTLGQQLGIDKIDYYAHAVGLGEPTGIDLPHEAAGLVPSPNWKERHLHQSWFKGETINVAIGQGALTVTPLQLAHTIGGIMMDGQFFRPHLVFPSEVPANLQPKGPDETRFAIPEPALQVIEAGMRGVVGPEGTAASAHLQGVDWGGKTGTAQTVSEEHFAASGHKHQFVDNAWFVGVYPLDQPQIVVCVLFQHGAEGYYAANIAAEVIAAYAQKQAARARTQTARLERWRRAFGPLAAGFAWVAPPLPAAPATQPSAFAVFKFRGGRP